MYEATIPVFIRSLANLLKIMEKAERHAKKRLQNPSTILKKRLYADMFNFTKQVQYSYFMALDVAGNLTGVETPKFAYDEKSMPELKKSLKQVIKYLKSIKPEDVKKYERRLVGKRIPVFFDLKQTLLPKDYVHNFALPNFFFHYVTAYDILRHYGVPIGKKDYLGPLSLPK
jgi:hypothetical protein